MLGIAKSHLHSSPVKSMSKIIKDVEKIEAEQLQQIANEVFDTESMSTLIFEAKMNNHD